MKKEHLLAEVEDLLRTMPSREDLGRRDDETIPWLGRAAAVIQRWSFTRLSFESGALLLRNLERDDMLPNSHGFTTLKTLLYQARADLQMEVGQLSVVVQQGQAFDYFDELRKVIETARSEVFFVDATNVIGRLAE